MKRYLVILIILSGYSLSCFAQTSSQTRTANLFNDIHESYVDSWVQKGPEYLSADDDSYAYTKKILPRMGSAMLLLQDFRFNIPGDATIENISVRARRFKTGKGAIKDYFESLIREHNLFPGFANFYGVRWVDPNFFSSAEAEVNYSQSGSGNNGWGDQPYQWTPAIINNPLFGVRFDVAPPEKGPVVVYYDLVEITVEYSQPVTIAGRSPDAAETRPLKGPIVYPNPFTTKTNIQFTAAESGKAVIELFNSNGSKIRTLISSNVARGQVYNVTVDAQLPKGIYVYRISNGKQTYKGRLIKVE